MEGEGAQGVGGPRRAIGHGTVEVEAVGGRSVATRLEASYPLKLMHPRKVRQGRALQGQGSSASLCQGRGHWPGRRLWLLFQAGCVCFLWSHALLGGEGSLCESESGQVVPRSG